MFKMFCVTLNSETCCTACDWNSGVPWCQPGVHVVGGDQELKVHRDTRKTADRTLCIPYSPVHPANISPPPPSMSPPLLHGNKC